MADAKFIMPDHITTAGRRLFEQIRAERHLRSIGDLQLLANAIEVWERAELLRAEIAAHGVTFRDRFQNIKPNPACDCERKCRVAFDGLLQGLPWNREANDEWSTMTGDEQIEFILNQQREDDDE